MLHVILSERDAIEYNVSSRQTYRDRRSWVAQYFITTENNIKVYKFYNVSFASYVISAKEKVNQQYFDVNFIFRT